MEPYELSEGKALKDIKEKDYEELVDLGYLIHDSSEVMISMLNKFPEKLKRFYHVCDRLYVVREVSNYFDEKNYNYFLTIAPEKVKMDNGIQYNIAKLGTKQHLDILKTIAINDMIHFEIVLRGYKDHLIYYTKYHKAEIRYMVASFLYHETLEILIDDSNDVVRDRAYKSLEELNLLLLEQHD